MKCTDHIRCYQWIPGTVQMVDVTDRYTAGIGATTSVNIGYPEITDASGGPYTVTHNATGNVQTTSGASNVTVSFGVGRIIVQWSVMDPNNIAVLLSKWWTSQTPPRHGDRSRPSQGDSRRGGVCDVHHLESSTYVI